MEVACNALFFFDKIERYEMSGKTERECLVNAVALMIAIAIVMLMVTPRFCLDFFTGANVEFSVKTKEYTTKDGYLVFTKNEVFAVKDCWAWWVFDSSDIYSAIEPGKTYRATVCSWRWPFFSMYRKIVRLEEKKE